MNSKTVFQLITALILLFVGVVQAAPLSTRGTTLLVSVAKTHGTSPAISAEGRFVAFQSAANNLVSGDNNHSTDIFVHDRQTNLTQRVSVASDGTESNNRSEKPSISGDGRFVAFRSAATNLVVDDTNDLADIFVHDRQTGLTQRVSVANDGTEANDTPGIPAISADGRLVVFMSRANNLVAGDANARTDIFVRDLELGETRLVSVSSDGVQSFSHSSAPTISADGRFVAFESDADNLATGDSNRRGDIFVHDLETGETQRVSVATDGTESNDYSFSPSISADGQSVTFFSTASNLVNGDTNARADVFVHNRQTGETRRASISSEGAQGNGGSFDSSISADGRFVAFSSLADNLGAGDNNRTADVFVHDLKTGETRWIPVIHDPKQTLRAASSPVVSANGQFIAFERADAIFVHDLAFSDVSAVAGSFNAPATGSQQNGEVTLGFEVSAPQGLQSVSLMFVENGPEFVVCEDGSLSGDCFGNRINKTVHLNPEAYGAEPGEVNISLWVQDEAGVSIRVADLIIDWSNITQPPAPGTTTLISKGHSPAMSANGQFVAFVSRASDLVADDTNGVDDVFVFNRQTGQTQLISMSSNGTQGNFFSAAPSISADGRFVAFQSRAGNIGVGDINGVIDIFVHDRQTSRTETVSVASDGSQSNNSSTSPAISANGQFVVFESNASNLVSGDTNGLRDIFVHDRHSGETQRVSVASDGTQANDRPEFPSISGDGRFVAFKSRATNLVDNDTNGAWDIFVHDRQTGETERVSVASDGRQSNYSSFDPFISTNGQFVAFTSEANNLVGPGNTNLRIDIFIHDRNTGVTERVSVARDGTLSNGSSGYPVLSAEGRFVLFSSAASNLIAGDNDDRGGIFISDRQTGEISRVSVARGRFSSTHSISANGQLVAFMSTDGVFVHEFAPSVTPVLTSRRISVSSDGIEANDRSDSPAFSADGRWVAFSSEANNLVEIDTNGEVDIFVHDRQTGEIQRVSISSDGRQSNGTSWGPVLSADGRFVAFSSWANNLVAGDNNDTLDVFVHDRQTGETQLVSLDNHDEPGEDSSDSPSISADGRFVAFASQARNFAPRSGSGAWDVFVRDLLLDVTTRISQTSDGMATNIFSGSPSISADGRFVVFRSFPDNLVPEDSNGKMDVFIHDRQTGETSRISIASDGTQGNNASHSSGFSISADGQWVVFMSDADNLVNGDSNNTQDIFVHDRQTGETQRISVASDGEQGNNPSISPSISANGRWVTFMSEANNLVSGDSNGKKDVFVHDRQTGETRLISIANDGMQGNGDSDYPFMSTNGAFVVFRSEASNLVAEDHNGVGDIFVYELFP